MLGRQLGMRKQAAGCCAQAGRKQGAPALECHPLTSRTLLCRVYLLPPGACQWAGLGFLGCDGSYECR